VLLGCNSEKVAQNPPASCFADQFSKEQSEVLKSALQVWNQFLQDNYPKGDISEKTQVYLGDLETYSLFNPNWKFNSFEAERVLKVYESTGLRKELYTRGDESDGFKVWAQEMIDKGYSDSLSLEDNRLAMYFNESGKFKSALLNCSEFYPILESYYEMRKEALNISPSIIIGGLQKSFEPEDYESAALQSVIFFELFSWQLKQHLDQQ